GLRSDWKVYFVLSALEKSLNGGLHSTILASLSAEKKFEDCSGVANTSSRSSLQPLGLGKSASINDGLATSRPDSRMSNPLNIRTKCECLSGPEVPGGSNSLNRCIAAIRNVPLPQHGSTTRRSSCGMSPKGSLRTM